MSEAGPQDTDESIFAVDTLLKYMGNDDKALAIVAKIVRDACAPVVDPMTEARQALHEQRWADAGKVFHSLRGSVGTLGARRLVRRSLLLEQAIAERHSEQIPTLFAAVENEYQQVLHQAALWLSQNPVQHDPFQG